MFIQLWKGEERYTFPSPKANILKPSQKQEERDEQNMRQKSKKAKKRGKPLEQDQKRRVAVATRTASQLWPAAYEKESQSGGTPETEGLKGVLPVFFPSSVGSVPTTPQLQHEVHIQALRGSVERRQVQVCLPLREN